MKLLKHVENFYTDSILLSILYFLFYGQSKIQPVGLMHNNTSVVSFRK